MSLKEILGESVLKEALLAEEIQQIVVNINSSNLTESIQKILSSMSILNKTTLNSLTQLIYSTLCFSINLEEILASFVIHISNFLLKENAEIFKSLLINSFIPLWSAYQRNSCFSRFRFIRKLVENDFVDKASIISKIEYCVDHVSQKTELHFLLLMWFHDYILMDKELYKKMTSEIRRMSRNLFSNDWKDAYYLFLKSEKENNFEKTTFLMNYGYEKDSIEYDIKYDNIEHFCPLFAFCKLSYKTLFKKSFFDSYEFFKNDFSIIDAAAFYGSIKIFKFLIQNVDDFLDLRQRLLYSAICGGNTEIIKYLYIKIQNALHSPKYATLFYRNVIFDWLEGIETSDFSTVMSTSCRANNIHCLLYCIQNNLSDVNSLRKGNSPLHISAINGHCDCLRILMALKGININLKNKDGISFLTFNTPLHFAVLSKNVEAVKLFLSEKTIDVNCKNLKGHTPLHLAAREVLEEIVKVLLDDPRIIITCYTTVFSKNLQQ